MITFILGMIFGGIITCVMAAFVAASIDDELNGRK